MPYVEFFIVDSVGLRFKIYGYVQLFFEITIHPHIMVADENGNANAAVRQLCQLAQQAGIALGDHLFVLEPEIESIAYQENRMLILCYAVQRAYDQPFPLPAGGSIGSAQMKV